MKEFYTYILITSLVLNVFLAFRTSDYYKPADVNIVKVVHKEGQSNAALPVSEDTTSFVIDFISKINQNCSDIHTSTYLKNTKII